METIRLNTIGDKIKLVVLLLICALGAHAFWENIGGWTGVLIFIVGISSISPLLPLLLLMPFRTILDRPYIRYQSVLRRNYPRYHSMWPLPGGNYPIAG